MIGPLIFIQLTVADREEALRWYEGGLGLRRLSPLDDPTFALLDAGSTQLALKVGEPLPGSVLLSFHVHNLTAVLESLAARGIEPCEPEKVSAEGYRRAKFRDPDGHTVTLFEWVQNAT